MGEKGLLVVSFGTSYPETRVKNIEALENELRSHFPERRFFRAWTSKIICRKLAKQGERIDSVEEALDRIADEGVRDLLVQTTHILAGEEFALTLEALKQYKGRFDAIRFGAPLLTDAQDLDELAHILEHSYPEVGRDCLLAFMGHGSDKIDRPIYEDLEKRFHRDGYDNFCVGTVEFQPGFAPILDRVRKEKPIKVFLTPLMVVAGDHASNDMAGDGPDSWRSQLQAEGVETVCLLRGLGEFPEIRNMYLRHADAAKALQ